VGKGNSSATVNPVECLLVTQPCALLCDIVLGNFPPIYPLPCPVGQPKSALQDLDKRANMKLWREQQRATEWALTTELDDSLPATW
jgi:hypothetical protein